MEMSDYMHKAVLEIGFLLGVNQYYRSHSFSEISER